MVGDTIGDTLTRIKNALTKEKSEVEVIYSKPVLGICEILKNENYIVDYKSNDKMTVTVQLTANNVKVKGINSIKRVSKPGIRKYRSYKELKPVREGYGIAIISTSKGLMTDAQARKSRSGGEVFCEIF